MSTFRMFCFLFFISLGFIQCNNSEQTEIKTCNCSSFVSKDSTGHETDSTYKYIQGALLATRFKSLEELKSVIQIEYDSTSSEYKMVRLIHCSNGQEVINELKSGISQGDMSKAQRGNFWTQLFFLFNSPYAVANRVELSKVYLLARRMTELFGEGDPAFFDLAQAEAKNINTPDLAFMNARDSSEKGYLNSFDHITAQAFVTSCFSEQLADFVGDMHERERPELITGKFSEEEIGDLDNGPVDNYVDLINNEWGQELGKVLKKKYNINQTTNWTRTLLVKYLNDLQSYYSWAFQIGFAPFTVDDDVVTRFSDKLNLVLSGTVTLKKK